MVMIGMRDSEIFEVFIFEQTDVQEETKPCIYNIMISPTKTACGNPPLPYMTAAEREIMGCARIEPAPVRAGRWESARCARGD
jgi:hypothetical protein